MTASPWTPANFATALDAWIAQEQPDDHLRRLVITWVLTRYDDPYQGVRRESGFPNLWFGVIPGSLHGADRVVVCSYWIFDSSRTVSCDSFATLPLPI